MQVRKHLITTTFLPLLNYEDLIFMNAPDQFLKKVDTVYHCALHFYYWLHHVHHCSFYAVTHCLSLYVCRLSHWLFFLNLFLDSCLHIYVYTVTQVQTLANMASVFRTSYRRRFRESNFEFSAPSTWNDVQKDLKLTQLVALEDFKTIIKDREISLIGSCHCTV